MCRLHTRWRLRNTTEKNSVNGNQIRNISLEKTLTVEPQTNKQTAEAHDIIVVVYCCSVTHGGPVRTSVEIM